VDATEVHLHPVATSNSAHLMQNTLIYCGLGRAHKAKVLWARPLTWSCCLLARSSGEDCLGGRGRAMLWPWYSMPSKLQSSC